MKTMNRAINSALPHVGTKTLIYAHRGAMAYRPQNTMPAFELAWEMGAAGIELDVQCSKDGVPIVFHDNDLEKLTGTKGRVRDYDLAALQTLDAGSHFTPKYADARIPTLETVLRARPINRFVNIELKTELAFGTISQPRKVLTRDPQSEMEKEAKRIALTTVECIRRIAQDVPDFLSHLIVSSFHPIALEAFATAMPNIMIGQLYSPTAEYDTAPLMASINCSSLHLDVNELTEEAVKQAHLAGKYVNCWTVNNEADVRRLIKWGVDGIITNYPDVMLKLVNK